MLKSYYSVNSFKTKCLVEIMMNLTESNYFETLAFLKISKVLYFRKILNNLDSALVNIYNDNPNILLSKSGIILQVINDISQRREPSKYLLKKVFPILGELIIAHGVNSNKINNLHLACIQSNIQDNEFFKQYCSEIELLHLSFGDNHKLFNLKDGFFFGINDYNFSNIILEINKRYPAIGGSFGYVYLSSEELVNEMLKIGYNKFIDNINRLIDSELHEEIFWDCKIIGRKLSDAPVHVKLALVDAIKQVGKEHIQSQTIIFVAYLLMGEPEIRKSSRIVESLPTSEVFPKEIIGQFIKVCEVELGINNVSEKHKFYKIETTLELNKYFTKENEIIARSSPLNTGAIDFLDKYYKISDDSTKQIVIEELIFCLIMEVMDIYSDTMNCTFIAPISNFVELVHTDTHIVEKCVLIDRFINVKSKEYLKKIFIENTKLSAINKNELINIRLQLLKSTDKTMIVDKVFTTIINLIPAA